MKSARKGRKDRKPKARAVKAAVARRGPAPIPAKQVRGHGQKGAGLQRPKWMLAK